MSDVAADVVVIGAGIVGAACAWVLARDGVSVHVLESGVPGGGATAAGMGHLVLIDQPEAEYALTRYSRDLWLQLAPAIPPEGEFRRCGTIWLAAGEEEYEAARSKHAWYGEHGLRSELLDSAALAAAEPNLRAGLAAGLLVPDDAVIYAPWVTRWLLQRSGATVSFGAAAVAVDGSGVTLADGGRIVCGAVVCATGCGATAMFPDLPLRPRKGHLAITDRYPGFVRHQLAELGYLKSAHGESRESVAFNVQPRATGQVLLGSSRQFGDESPDVRWPVLSRMIRHATEFMPALAGLQVTRVWTGFRAASDDGLPLIGPYGDAENVVLATGHEGLGITTALATGELVAAHILGREPAIPAAPYLPSRFGVRVNA
jgi:glycine/D-amino acid oxidase-like deaminating enzyme